MKDFRTCMKGLAAMGRPLRGRILVSCIIGVFRIAASMAFVWVCKALVDIATGESDAPLGLYVGLMIGIMLAQVILSTAFSWWEGMIVTKTQNSFRAKVFGHVLASEWHGREAFHSGDMVNRLFKGNAQELVAALVKGNGLSSADIDELRAMFKVEGD